MLSGALLGASGLSACHGLRSKDVGQALVGQEFLLQSAEGVELFAGVPLKLGFSADEFNFTANCNRHFGSYQVDGGRLVVMSIGSTEMGCGDAEQTQDAWLSGFFLAKPRVAWRDQTLTLSEGDERLVFLERAAAESAASASEVAAPKP